LSTQDPSSLRDGGTLNIGSKCLLLGSDFREKTWMLMGINYSMGGRAKALEEKAKLGLDEAKTEAAQILSDGKQIVKDAKDKVTK